MKTKQDYFKRGGERQMSGPSKYSRRRIACLINVCRHIFRFLGFYGEAGVMIDFSFLEDVSAILGKKNPSKKLYGD